MSFQAFFKGWLGEQGTRLAQMLTLDSKQYHVFYDVMVKIGARSTQIDHVIVSKYGVFVVETKNKTGWIFGQADDSLWTQVIFNAKIRFPNPLRQNYLHTRAIADFCAIDHNKIHSVVVFWGDCKFKTRMPENVVRWPDYPRYIKSKTQVLLNDAEVDSVCNRLNTVKGGIPILSNLRHAEEIKNQYNRPDICPRCGGRLLERTTRTGEAAGQSFTGCENYPQCRFTRNPK